MLTENEIIQLQDKELKSESLPKEPEISTICRDCIFAQFDRNQVQTGCEWGRLERFEKNGGISKVEENGKIYYRIPRFCTTCRGRDSDWYKQVPPNQWMAEVAKDISLKQTLIGIYTEKNNIYQLRDFVDSCLAQTHLPVEIIILNVASIKAAIEISNFWNEKSLELPDNINFKNIFTLEGNCNDDYLNMCLGKITGSYFSVFELPYKIPQNFVESLHIALNERCERFLYLKGEQGTTVQTVVFERLKGNRPSKVGDEKEISGIFNKLNYVAEMYNEQYFIKNLDEVVV